MQVISPAASYVMGHPRGFVVRVLKGFQANQGLLLAGAPGADVEVAVRTSSNGRTALDTFPMIGVSLPA